MAVADYAAQSGVLPYENPDYHHQNSMPAEVAVEPAVCNLTAAEAVPTLYELPELPTYSSPEMLQVEPDVP